ncbi:MAG: response regulator [Methyloprofundus sp.]|nr:response regulator [Methyloprofundus sp.]
MIKSKPYILCADDDPVNNELVEIYLEDEYEVQCVCNGQECLDAVAQRQPDLILLDVMMPVMGGKETCEYLKNSPDTKHIPIVVLSAQSYEDDIKVMLDLGVYGYITKPFDSQQLKKVIEGYFRAE